MGGTNFLEQFIDNGGQRSFIERRRKSNVIYLWERRSNSDRRQIVDRRTALNQIRLNGPERRTVLKKWFF
ncbi:hypothetical protein D1AOALGA4SA_2326 [Olavius algarvensis Delta 1 endosymbiont]|nr:hypothetical protein D1AOALGA4SA_2326 [Olavius algarvensis Delta 1 endosymbiont]